MNGMQYRDWIGSMLAINEEMLHLTQQECRDIGLKDEEIIELTRQAMIAYSTNKAEMPAKIGIHPLDNTFSHAMPAYVPDSLACGIKWISCYPDNRQRFGYSQTTGVLILNDLESGSPMCIMDAVYVTEMRTAAVAVCAAKKLARTSSRVLGMVGCGVQGNAHIAMMRHALPNLEEIYIIDNYAPAMDALITRQQPHLDARIIIARSFEEIARKCDVICSAAVIKDQPDPMFEDEWFHEGQTILTSDCHTFYPDRTMKRADKYLVDSVEQHELLRGAGYYPDGLPDIYAETGLVLAGIKRGRENDKEFIVCNNVGMAVEDMVVARRIFDVALEKGVGRRFAL